MTFKELRNTIDEPFIILDTKDGRLNDFSTKNKKYDEHEVCTVQWTDKGIFVAID